MSDHGPLEWFQILRRAAKRSRLRGEDNVRSFASVEGVELREDIAETLYLT